MEQDALIEQTARQWARAFAGRRVAVFGGSKVGCAVVRRFRQGGIDVVAVFDEHIPAGCLAEGYAISHPSRVVEAAPDLVVLATLNARGPLRRRLEKFGYRGPIVELPGRDSAVYDQGERKPVPEIEAFRNRYAGRPCFVCGNGPSLLKTDPRRIGDAVTFAANNIFLLEGFTPTLYCVTDPLIAEQGHQKINSLPWVKFFPRPFAKWFTNGHFFNSSHVPAPEEFRTDAALEVEVSGSVVYSILQLVYYMGCDPVYLIGMDHTYNISADQVDESGMVLVSKRDDPSHFHPDYFGKGQKWHHPRLDYAEAAYRLTRAAYEKAGRTIRNATQGGRLEIFERVEFECVVRGCRPPSDPKRNSLAARGNTLDPASPVTRPA